MKVLFERLLDAECRELDQLGIELSLENLSGRLRSLASGHELQDSLNRWIAKQSTPVETLIKSGFSQPVIDVFSKPFAGHLKNR